MGLYDFRSIYLPYCLQKQKDGGYLVLNRNYKPVGFNTQEHIKYEDFPVATKFPGINKKTATLLSINASDDVKEIFLYDDATNPIRNKKNMDSYLEKVERLAKLKTK
ncbi:MAG: hypothetical protein Q7W45_08485 [Bacteroidota bacterium]|nr:hypothetical protein [Bacteroidota bacterium]MDP3144285.1 hypothetical protein [Bacteroidota bacterium]